jgi:cold shock CspA family protein/ribosome-associated translation inhibitor RaiA
MQVIFHEVPRSQWVEEYIAERVQRLDRFAAGITSCRVSLTREGASHQKGNRYSVLVEARVPPQHDLAVRKQKTIHDMRQQLPALINLAFGALERQLKKAADLRRHADESSDGQPHGMVERLYEEGYGFIRALDDNRQFYFHRNSVLHGDFDRLAIGAEVRFSPEEGEKGPQASSVQLVAPSPG